MLTFPMMRLPWMAPLVTLLPKIVVTAVPLPVAALESTNWVALFTDTTVAPAGMLALPVTGMPG